MKKLFRISLLILFHFVISHKIDAQKQINTCTESYDRWALVCVRTVIYSDNFQEKREEASLAGIDMETNSLGSLTHVSENLKCTQIQNYIQSVPFIKNIDDNTEHTKYFYQTNQFYFVFWGPEPGKHRLNSVNGVVIAIQKDFSSHAIF